MRNRSLSTLVLWLVLAMSAAGCSGSSPAPRCGDGTLDPGEACDDGATNSDVRPDACRTDCSKPRCGDGVVDAGEGCDGGAANSDVTPNACRNSCTRPRCGDGVVDAGEGCDEGAANSDITPDACRTDCRPPRCGDGVVDPGEACDDGNLDDTDGCLHTCAIASCGDGYLHAGVEQCEPSVPVPCVTSCSSAGLVECLPGCLTGACLAPAELCNGVDDDCDGVADNGFACVQGRPTSCLTTCGTIGTGTCSTDCAGPAPAACVPPAEVCNGIDDDCDGVVDDSPIDAGQPCCPTGNLADCQNSGGGSRCRVGGTVCSGAALACSGAVARSAETCNGIDDDCDGIVDDVPGVGVACTGGGVNTTGACRAAWACDGTPGPGPHGLACRQVVGPTSETCNGVDDDCDGTVDDNPTDVGGTCCAFTSCTTQGVWACANGVRACVGSSSVGSCSTPGEPCCPTGNLADCQNTGAGTRCQVGTCSIWADCPGAVARAVETCNGVDDDCNGVVDDVPGVGVACAGGGVNTTGACRASWACTGSPGPGPNGLTCGQAVGPTPEVCNGVDDNCNGTVDDNPTDVGGTCCAFTSCTTLGVWACANGVRTCVGSSR